MKLNFVLIFSALIGSVFSGVAQSKALLQKIREVENNLHSPYGFAWKDSLPSAYPLAARMEKFGVPAVSIAVVEDGKLLWSRAYGRSDLAENRPADINTIFQAASISKSINAIAVLKLVEERKLDLDRDIHDEVNRNISDFRDARFKFGYGYMWWLWQDVLDERYRNAFCAMGVLGQNISVFPSADVVIVYKTKAAYERVNTLAIRLKAIALGIESLEGVKSRTLK